MGNYKMTATFDSGRLPNLIIIGAMKCGTSSLHNYLNLHPQIHMSEVKELDFFIKEKNWKKGEDWYRSYFRKKAKVLGESSPNYTKFHIFSHVPERMHDLIPDAKLIYIVRDPIQRAISHYLHQYTDLAESRTIEKALSDCETNHYVCTSRYALQIKKFLEHFDISQILVITLEDLAKKRLETLRTVFAFLEVDSDFHHPSFSQVFHRSDEKNRLTKLGETLFKFPCGGRFTQVIPNLMFRDIPKPTISESFRSMLISSLKEDLREMEDIAGKRLWPYL